MPQTIHVSIGTGPDETVPIVNITVGGDSLTELGDGIGYAWPSWPTMLATITGRTVDNIAHAGANLEAILANISSEAAFDSSMNTYVYLGGANNGATSYADLIQLDQDICAEAYAEGADLVFIMIEPPRAGGGANHGHSSDHVQRFDWIRANWASIADGFVELDTPPAYPHPGRIYTADGLHTNPRSNWRIANAVRAAMGLPYAATDTTPNSFTLNDVTGVSKDTLVTSNVIEFSTITAPAPFTVSGGVAMINGEDAGASGFVNPWDLVAVRVTSSGSNSTGVSATLTVGGVSDTFTATTGTAAASTMNWDNPPVSGSLTYSGSDTKITQNNTTEVEVVSKDAAFVGKKVVAVRTTHDFANNGNDYAGVGVTSRASVSNFWNDGKSVAVWNGAGMYYNGGQKFGGGNVGIAYVTPVTTGFVIDEVAKKLWVTFDGVVFIGPAGAETNAAGVVAGTGSFDASEFTGGLFDGDPIYIGANSVFGTGNGATYELLRYWPWDLSVLTGYTLLGT